MIELADNFEEFDLAYIAGPKRRLPLEYTRAASTPSDLAPALEMA